MKGDKSMHWPRCGLDEFITDLNRYDVYRVVNGSLCHMRTELIDSVERLYCRDCGQPLACSQDTSPTSKGNAS